MAGHGLYFRAGPAVRFKRLVMNAAQRPGSHAYRTLRAVVAPLLVPILYLAAAWGQPANAGVSLPVLTRISQIRQLTFAIRPHSAIQSEFMRW